MAAVVLPLLRLSDGPCLSFTSFVYIRADGQQQRDGHHQRNYHSDGGKHWGDAHKAEVTQLYLGFPEAAGEPPRQLRGFVKTKPLAPGARTTLRFLLSARDLSVWDVASHGWLLVAGSHRVYVGASSGDLRLSGTVHAQ